MSVTYVSTALRRLVRERAGDRCEYCLTPESITFAVHEIDHVIAEKHGGATTTENLCLACMICNQRKGTDLATVHPLTQELVPLFNPRRENWLDHFRLNGATVEGLTPIGMVTVHFLQFNTPDRVEERLIVADEEFQAAVQRFYSANRP